MNRLIITLIILTFTVSQGSAVQSCSTALTGLPLKPNGSELTLVKKVLVSDCCVIRGFLGTAVDGFIRWGLQHGIYKLIIGPDNDGDHKMDKVDSQKIIELSKASRIELNLPPKAVTVIEIEQQPKLNPIF
jgi:GTPase